MMNALAMRIRARFAENGDEGFTLVELLAAMAIFSILMAMISAVLLSGISGLTHLAKSNEDQMVNQRVAESVARVLRYAGKPEITRDAFVCASSTSLVFYSSSGFALSNDVPNKVHIWFDSTTKNMYMSIIPATMNPDNDGVSSTPDTWQWATASACPANPANDPVAYRHVLMKSDPETPTTSPLHFKVLLGCLQSGCATRSPGTLLNGTTEAPVTLTTQEIVQSVEVIVGDPTVGSDGKLPSNTVSQQVRLQNLNPVIQS